MRRGMGGRVGVAEPLEDRDAVDGMMRVRGGQRV